jgi:hypothetical protein
MFEWPVDQAGYEIEHVEPREVDGDSVLLGLPQGVRPHWSEPGLLSAGKFAYDVIRPCGGPLRYYRPLTEHPDLWRRFANISLSFEGVLGFVREFGLLSSEDYSMHDPGQILRTAARMLQIATKFDNQDRAAAAELLHTDLPVVTEILFWNDQRAQTETRFVPIDLRSALLHQATDAIAGNVQWRRCRNFGCPHWFRLGRGGVTARREFCSDRCRVAHARRQKREANAHA